MAHSSTPPPDAQGRCTLTDDDVRRIRDGVADDAALSDDPRMRELADVVRRSPLGQVRRLIEGWDQRD